MMQSDVHLSDLLGRLLVIDVNVDHQGPDVIRRMSVPARSLPAFD
jgi:hypothetical protein